MGVCGTYHAKKLSTARATAFHVLVAIETGRTHGHSPEALVIALAKPAFDWTTIFIGSVNASTKTCHVFCVVKPR